MIISKNISHRYHPEGNSLSFPDIHCKTGEALLITGPSGSGKTSLLSIIGGLMQPTAGQIFIGDTELYRDSSTATDRFRGQHIGLVLQQHHFIGSLSVLQNLLLPQKLGQRKPNTALVLNLLKELDLLHKQHEHPLKLSIGEKQRLGIARALINQPSVILADEPTSSLDDDNCNRVITLLKKEAGLKQAALLVVTHDMRLKQEFSNVVSL